MKTKMLQNVLERVEGWPPNAQDALAEIALELEAEMTGVYHATSEELAGINRGLYQPADCLTLGDSQISYEMLQLGKRRGVPWDRRLR